MERHENHCTMNPNRDCDMCGYADSSSIDLRALSRMVKGRVIVSNTEQSFESYSIDGSETDVINEIRKATDCPACILAVIRQSEYPFMFGSFDYKKEREELWKNHNDAMADVRADHVASKNAVLF